MLTNTLLAFACVFMLIAIWKLAQTYTAMSVPDQAAQVMKAASIGLVGVVLMVVFIILKVVGY